MNNCVDVVSLLYIWGQFNSIYVIQWGGWWVVEDRSVRGRVEFYILLLLRPNVCFDDPVVAFGNHVQRVAGFIVPKSAHLANIN